MDVKENLVAQAEYAHSQYPQYKNHWNDWVVVTITKDIKSKAGNVHFAKGDIVLVNPKTLDHEIECGPKQGKVSPTCYSFRTNCDTSLGGPFVKIQNNS